MATKTIVELIDDIDGSTADEEVTFGLDGVNYEIDLSEANADKLREALDIWIAHGRRTGGRRTLHSERTPKVVAKVAKTPTGGPFSVPERRAMQKFAKLNGMPIPGDRGRIARTVSDAWDEAGRPE